MTIDIIQTYQENQCPLILGIHVGENLNGKNSLTPVKEYKNGKEVQEEISKILEESIPKILEESIPKELLRSGQKQETSVEKKNVFSHNRRPPWSLHKKHHYNLAGQTLSYRRNLAIKAYVQDDGSIKMTHNDKTYRGYYTKMTEMLCKDLGQGKPTSPNAEWVTSIGETLQQRRNRLERERA